MKSTFNIQNLKCGGCANTIVTRLENLDGITGVIVDNDNHTVSFNHENETQIETVKTLLSTLGYPVEGEANPLTKKAKSFVSCAVGRMNK
ncbi:heavy metal-associated domain-containing protein [uncultured Psychroserpens sp.]|uniref:heavy-metal-associated domain-containing protein n=1 Tax=uncultured Psychroserpens sp. TaxID=255436 RepID=UPI002605D562|nr:heavy metal-associated domain-containing protein [uncultured Psychroserpens sp.]